MGYLNPNRTLKDPSRTRIEIYIYPNETEIFNPKNLNSPESNPNGCPNGPLLVKNKAKRYFTIIVILKYKLFPFPKKEK